MLCTVPAEDVPITAASAARVAMQSNYGYVKASGEKEAVAIFLRHFASNPFRQTSLNLK